MMIVDGRNGVLVIDCRYVGLRVVVDVHDDDDLLVDKCAKDDFVYFESVGVVCWLLPTPK